MSGSEAARRDAGWRPQANPWLIAIVVTVSSAMEILDTTIVNVSLPHIAGAMSASYDEATWTLTSYLVANGIVLPISGWIGRVVGRKRYYMICIAMFTACSFLCGISTSLGELVVFRLLQGLFGGGLQPNQQAIILDTFEPSQRGRAFSVVAIAVIVAPIVGPTLGGWITDSFSWRWIFLINVPVGLFGLFAVGALVEDPPWVVREHRSGARRHFDGIGLGLIVLGIGSLQVMLDRGEDLDWFTSPTIRLFGILAAIGIAAAVCWLLYAENPIVNLRVLKDRNFALGSVMIFCIGVILYSSSVIIPQLAQEQLGYTALLAGLILSPGGLVVLFLIPIVGRMLPRVQTRFIIAFGFFVMGCALSWAYFMITPGLDFFTLALIRTAQAAGLAFLFVPTSTIAYSTLPKEVNNDASALYVMFRNLAGSIGISLVTAYQRESVQTSRALLVHNLTPLNPAYQQTLARVQSSLEAMGRTHAVAHQQALGWMNQMLNGQAAILSYMDVFAISAIAAFAVVPLAFLFAPTKAGGRGAPAH